jgi:hypothetical protein
MKENYKISQMKTNLRETASILIKFQFNTTLAFLNLSPMKNQRPVEKKILHFLQTIIFSFQNYFRGNAS